MRNAIFLFSVLMMAQASHAAPKCYEFSVKEDYSPGMDKVRITMQDKKHGARSAVMEGFSLKGSTMKATFECKTNKEGDFCTQAGGAGDFLLSSEKGKAIMKLTYVNLQIAQPNLIANKPGQEIGEEFAIFGVDNSGGDDDDDDDENPADELASVSITGSVIKCAVKH